MIQSLIYVYKRVRIERSVVVRYKNEHYICSSFFNGSRAIMNHKDKSIH